jgi:hypothetical protein
MDTPCVTKFVTINPTNVVTRAMPPIRKGALVKAIFIINGPKIVVVSEKIRTAMKNDIVSIENPSTNIVAKNKPTAFAIRARVKRARKRTINKNI